MQFISPSISDVWSSSTLLQVRVFISFWSRTCLNVVLGCARLLFVGLFVDSHVAVCLSVFLFVFFIQKFKMFLFVIW